MPLFGELLQDAGIGRGTGWRPLEHGQLQALEENLSELGVGVDVELLARGGIDLLLHAQALALKAFLERREPWQIDRDAIPFDFGEHVHEGHLDVAEERHELQRLELRRERVAQAPRHVRVLARVVARALDRHLVVWQRVLSLPAEYLEARQLVAQKLERQLIERVRATSWIEHVARDHRVEFEATQRDTRTAQC